MVEVRPQLRQRITATPTCRPLPRKRSISSILPDCASPVGSPHRCRNASEQVSLIGYPLVKNAFGRSPASASYECVRQCTMKHNPSLSVVVGVPLVYCAHHGLTLCSHGRIGQESKTFRIVAVAGCCLTVRSPSLIFVSANFRLAYCPSRPSGTQGVAIRGRLSPFCRQADAVQRYGAGVRPWRLITSASAAGSGGPVAAATTAAISRK
jgi:hypothetical protein